MGKLIITFCLIVSLSFPTLRAHPPRDDTLGGARAFIVNLLPIKATNASQPDDIESQVSSLSTAPLLQEQEPENTKCCLNNCCELIGISAAIPVMCGLIVGLIGLICWPIVGFFQNACGCCRCIPNVCPC